VIAIDALIIIDMQEDYVGINRNKAAYSYDAEKLISDINMRIEQYCQNDNAIIYIQNVAKGRKSEFAKGLKIVPAPVFEKQKASCFTNHELSAFLTENSISNIEIVGVDGNYCVGMSALEGVKLGFTAKLILECIGVCRPDKFEKMKTRLIKAGVILNSAL
jgi:nicotinamidase-related amidase